MAKIFNHDKLHHDIFVHILSKLSVKSLFQLIAVCKAWRFSVSFSLDFILAHFLVAKQNPSYKHIIRIQPSMAEGCRCIPNCHCYQVMIDETRISPSFYDDTIVDSDFEILASFKGMLLVGFRLHDLYLWNPTTGSHKKLRFRDDMYHCRHALRMYGISFDSSCRTLRVISIVRLIDKFETTATVRIYNSRTDLWERKMSGDHYFPYVVFRCQRGVDWNGIAHLVVSRLEGGGMVVIYFDVGDREFKELGFPVFVLEESRAALAVSNGFLYLKFGCQTWVMRQHGGSWIELMDTEGSELVDFKFEEDFSEVSYVESPISPHIGSQSDV